MLSTVSLVIIRYPQSEKVELSHVMAMKHAYTCVTSLFYLEYNFICTSYKKKFVLIFINQVRLFAFVTGVLIMITVLLFKRVGTLQLSSYGITVITRYAMVRAYLIIYVYNLNGYQNTIYSE